MERGTQDLKREQAALKRRSTQAKKQQEDHLRQCKAQFRRIAFPGSVADTFQYKAFITRRCFNLNDYYCIQKSRRPALMDRTALSDEQRGAFISQNALFAYAPEIAAQYARSCGETEDPDQAGQFPKILVVDEVMFHGREVIGFLRQFEAAVLDELSQKHEISEQQMDKAPDAFLNAVTISYFWRFRDGELLEPRYRSCVRPLRPVRKDAEKDRKDRPDRSISECRMFTQTVTAALMRSGVMENTSYIPFFRLDRQQYDRLTDHLSHLPGGRAWRRSVWTYCRLENTEIWQPDPFRNGPDIRFLWTLRAHADPKMAPDGTPRSMRVLILPLFSEAPRNVMMRVKDRIAEVMEQEPPEAGLAHFIRFMRNCCERVKPAQVLLILFLLSVIEFYRLVENAGIDYDPDASDWSPHAQSPHDLDKIARNFGKGEHVWTGVRYLCGTGAASRELRKKIWQVLRECQDGLVPFWHAGSAERRKSGSDTGNDMNDLYLREAEDFFCRVTERDEERMASDIRAGGYYRLDRMKTDLYTFVGGYFGHFQERFRHTDRDRALSLEHCTAALLMMMDAGVASLVPRLDPLQRDRFNGCDVQNMLRSGIMAQISKPRRYARFLPALIRLEEYGLKNGLYPWELAGRFGAYLDGRSGGDHEMLFRRFVYQIYSQRQQLQHWDLDMLLCLDKPDRAKHVRTVEDWSLAPRSEEEWAQIEACADHDAYVLWERRNQEIYVKEAEAFLLTLNRRSSEHTEKGG